MKSVALELLDDLSVLYHIGALTADERNEFAKAAMMAMNNNYMYLALQKRLSAKANTFPDGTPARKHFSDCLERLGAATSQLR